MRKAAEIGFIRNLSGEVGRQGITANALSLGAINNWEGSEQKASEAARQGTRSPMMLGTTRLTPTSTGVVWTTPPVPTKLHSWLHLGQLPTD